MVTYHDSTTSDIIITNMTEHSVIFLSSLLTRTQVANNSLIGCETNNSLMWCEINNSLMG